jgi:hypothetical protein
MTKAKKAAPQLKPNRALQKLFKIMTPDQARRLARLADTSVPHLRHVAAGRRNMSAELAQQLAAASARFGKPPLLLKQVDLCRACSICPIRKQ